MTWESYTKAHVRVESPSWLIEVMPAPASGISQPFPDPTGRTIHIITAYNPNGRDRSNEVNLTNHQSGKETAKE